MNNRIFVFGSNLQGIHGKGSARHAKLFYNAVQGVGEGLTGMAYALPTKIAPYVYMSEEQLKHHINVFKEFATTSNLEFLLNKVGTVNAGFPESLVKDLLKDCSSNCLLPGTWSNENRVIVAGTKFFDDKDFIYDKIYNLTKNLDTFKIVSGLARGPDTFGKKYAEDLNIECVEFPADWDRLGKVAGMVRNNEMAIYGSHLIAFWDGVSRGTKNMIELAKRENLKVRVVLI